MTTFIQREIARARTVAGVVRCRECAGAPPGRGRPIAGATGSLYQVAGAFRLGAVWASRGSAPGGAGRGCAAALGRQTRPVVSLCQTDEPLAALEPFARIGTDLLVPYPPTPDFLEACEALALRVTLVLPAPSIAESLTQWRDRCLPKPQALPYPLTAVTGWALDLDARPGEPKRTRPDPLVTGALAALGQLTGKPVALLGLRLPLREAPATAPAYGIRLDAPGALRHLAEQRRALCRAADALGGCVVHGLRAAPPDPERLPRCWALGGAERYQAEALAERVTICFSVPGITGAFCDRLVDLPSDDGSGLLAADLRPKRAYKLLRALLQHEWRTRARGTTDDLGEFTWPGFHGAYELTATLPDGRICRDERVFTAADPRPVLWEVRAVS